MSVQRFAPTLIAAVFAIALFTTLTACATTSAHAPQPARQLRVVNATFASVVSLAVAPAQTHDFADVDFAAPLQGGENAVVVNVPPGQCLRDLRVTFRDGRTLTYAALDVCRYHAVRLSHGATGRVLAIKG